MSPHKKTTALIEASHCVLEGYRPMTLRQLYYQLVSLKVIENVQASYDALGRALVNARKEGLIPWDWIEDRLRRPRSVPQWSDLADFAETACRSYRRDVWEEQDIYLEAWLEKDALSGIFEAVLGPYGVTLNVGRGYDGWSSLYAASRRFGDIEGLSGNSGSVSDLPATMKILAEGNPSAARIWRTALARSADSAQGPSPVLAGTLLVAVWPTMAMR